MATFMDYLQEAHHRLDRARMLDDEANRTGLAFVTTELAASRRFAEAALAAFSAGDTGRCEASCMGGEDDVSCCATVSSQTPRPRRRARRRLCGSWET